MRIMKKHKAKAVLIQCIGLFIVWEINNCNSKSCWASDIHYAVGGGDLNEVRKLLKKNPESVNEIGVYTSPRSWEEYSIFLYYAAKETISWSDYWGTPLQLAVENGDTAMTELLIQHGADVNIPQADGSTVLYLAMKHRYNNLCDLLFKHGARHNIFTAAGLGDISAVTSLVNHDPNVLQVRDYENRTALHWAAKEGRLKTVKYLLDKGADIHATNQHKVSRSETALHYASKHVDISKILIEKGAKINAGDRYGVTPLQYAARDGNIDVVKMLVSSGADVNIKDTYWGHCALHRAAAKGYKQIVELLLANGADVYVRDNTYKDVLHIAVENDYHDIVKVILNYRYRKDALAYACMCNANMMKQYLEKYPQFIRARDYQRWTALHYATAWGDPEVVKLLLDAGADREAKTITGESPLHWAARWGKLKCVEILAAQGADINIRDNNGMTPLHKAASKGQVEVVKYFLDQGMDVNIQDDEGESPLWWAASFGKRDAANFLLQKGADMNLKDRHEISPFRESVQKGHKPIVELFLEKGADVNEKLKSGWTILHDAVHWADEPELVEFLISKEANINAVYRENGQTPLHMAISKGNKKNVEILLSKGVDVKAKDNLGRNALRIASEEKQPEIVQLLRQNLGMK